MKKIQIKLNIDGNQHALLKNAASILDINLNHFILDCACREATEVMLNQTQFVVSSDDFDKFTKVLDAPIPNISNLKALLKKPSLWE